MSVTGPGSRLISLHLLRSTPLLPGVRPFHSHTQAQRQRAINRRRRGGRSMSDGGSAKAVHVPTAISFATGNANKLKEVCQLAIGLGPYRQCTVKEFNDSGAPQASVPCQQTSFRSAAVLGCTQRRQLMSQALGAAQHWQPATRCLLGHMGELRQASPSYLRTRYHWLRERSGGSHKIACDSR